jgi:hypothetical protein
LDDPSELYLLALHKWHPIFGINLKLKHFVSIDAPLPSAETLLQLLYNFHIQHMEKTALSSQIMMGLCGDLYFVTLTAYACSHHRLETEHE